MADPGSGPGGVTALLHELGVPAFGIGLSPEMVAPAREAHPQLRFHTGSMMSLNIPSASLAEFHRTLRPGAPALLAFQTRHYYWRTAGQVIALLVEAGLALTATVCREPMGGESRAGTFILARRP
ncbi:class I SAM-dependent methyltransferase [Streptomyces griseofuscus]|uniref:class I SAM-dependent methyltransferase n=1 Tax=Streptomyces griseofuscus TaxID=146922 RepID=UPI003711E16B